MTVYQISYDLNDPGQNYEDIHDAIDGLGPSFHALDSTWFVDVSLDTSDVKEELKDGANSNDSILVTKMPSSGGGRWSYTSISGGLGDWLREHL